MHPIRKMFTHASLQLAGENQLTGIRIKETLAGRSQQIAETTKKSKHLLLRLHITHTPTGQWQQLIEILKAAGVMQQLQEGDVICKRRRLIIERALAFGGQL